MTTDDPSIEGAFQAVVQLREAARTTETQAVLDARSAGWTWQRIAGRLGISHQATMKKYAALVAADLKRRSQA